MENNQNNNFQNNYDTEIKEYSEDELKIIEEGKVQIKFPDFDKVSSDAPVFIILEWNSIGTIQSLHSRHTKGKWIGK